jgi:DNA replication and repair protein RecF
VLLTPSVSPLAGIVRLSVQAFRSYDSYTLSLTNPVSVALIGPNGVGKTNILEAVSLLTAGRGLRRAGSSLIQKISSETPWAISATFETKVGPLHVRTGRLDLISERRTSQVEGMPLKTQKALSGYVHALWLTPAMDGLFRDGETARRRFLDRLVLGQFAHHGLHVLRYEKALTERAKLFETPGAPPQWFEALEESLCEEGVQITQNRLHFLERLSVLLEKTEGPFPSATLALEGDLEHQIRAHGPDQARSWARATLRTHRTTYPLRSRALIGPHTSKLQGFFEGTLPAEQCSTGQQKMLLISLILAACKLQTQHLSGDFPITLLLLDDLPAHLDLFHRQALFETLDRLPLQVWLSSTDAYLLKGFDAQPFVLKTGA